MLNVTIQNDKKIKIQTECSNVKLTQSFDKSFIDKIKNALEAKECICEITKN